MMAKVMVSLDMVMVRRPGDVSNGELGKRGGGVGSNYYGSRRFFFYTWRW